MPKIFSRHRAYQSASFCSRHYLELYVLCTLTNFARIDADIEILITEAEFKSLPRSTAASSFNSSYNRYPIVSKDLKPLFWWPARNHYLVDNAMMFSFSQRKGRRRIAPSLVSGQWTNDSTASKIYWPVGKAHCNLTMNLTVKRRLHWPGNFKPGIQRANCSYNGF